MKIHVDGHVRKGYHKILSSAGVYLYPKGMCFRFYLALFLHFLLEGASGFGRPSSSVEYNQSPVASVMQSSSLPYQRSHPQSEQPNKNFVFWGSQNSVLCFYCMQSCSSLVIFTASGKQINISLTRYTKSFERFDMAHHYVLDNN